MSVMVQYLKIVFWPSNSLNGLSVFSVTRFTLWNVLWVYNEKRLW